MFSSQSFILLAFIFRLMAHPPEISFCLWCEVGAEVHFFFSIWISISSTISCKDFPSLLNCSGTLEGKLLSKCWVYSRALCRSLIYLYILMPILHCFDYYNLMVSLELDSISTHFCCSFSRFFSAILGPLHFHINFKSRLVHFH